jgi:hypothetical protein
MKYFLYSSVVFKKYCLQKNVLIEISNRQSGKKNSSERNKEKIVLETKENHTQMRRKITLKYALDT